MTCKIIFIVPVVLCGVFGYPTPPNIQGYSAHLPSVKNGKLEEIYIRPSGYGRSDSGSSLGHFNHPDLTQVITSRPGYSAEFNVRQDPPPSEDELQGYNGDRQKRQATAQNNEEAEDDSDMYMEPQDDQTNESTHNTETQQEPQTNHEEVVEEDESANEETEEAENQKDNDGDSQHFFPSFAPVFSLGHSRPPQLFHQEPFYNKPRNPPLLRPEYNPFRAYRDSSFKVPVVVEDDATSSNILGSGNFGVIRGGTYFHDEDRDEAGSLFSPYYSNNGHGRPYISNPRPQKYANGDFFANFRDFADINTPTKASFSEYVIVYVNKNGSKVDNVPGETARPKNIIEQLSLLDKEENPAENEIPQKKLSSHKRKLSLLHQEKLNKQKKSYFKKKESSPKDLVEPLLALS